jgi:hypothetical protein
MKSNRNYLINSIKAFNIDNIPVVTCVKDSDIDLYKNKFASYDITFIKDSDVYDTPMDNPWYKQQLIKLNFWKLNISKFILQMDSDSFFIRNFYISDLVPPVENGKIKKLLLKDNSGREIEKPIENIVISNSLIDARIHFLHTTDPFYIIHDGLIWKVIDDYRFL